MSNYFETFNRVEYDINNDGNPLQLTDITLRYRFKQAFAQNRYSYYTYTVRDGERIDTLAHKYYGNSKYAWLILLTNDMIDPYYDWILPQPVFNAHIQKKYGSVATAINTVHHYEQIGILKGGVLVKYPDPITVQKDVYDLIKNTKSDLGEDVAKSVSIYDYETDLNEQKRNIKLIDRTQLREVLELVNRIFK